MRIPPLKLTGCETGEIISLLFEPDELVCCGTVNNLETLTTSWSGHPSGAIAEQIVPNSMRARLGINKSNKELCETPRYDRSEEIPCG